MSLVLLPIDAAAGSPSFSAQSHRKAEAVMLAAPAATQPRYGVGARSGFRPLPGGIPITIAGSVWSLGECTFAVDSGTGVGPYIGAVVDTETGTLDPADATNPRVDRLDLQVPDDPPGSSPRNAVLVYTKGAAAASPVTPPAAARSMPVAEFSVPASGKGSPSVVVTAVYMVASGGIRPAAAFPATGGFVGEAVYDTTHHEMKMWDGSGWRYSGARGVIARFTNAAQTTHGSNATNMVAGNVNVVAGRFYRVTGNVWGNQSNASGTPYARMYVDGSEVARPLSAVLYSAANSPTGNSDYFFTATSTGSIAVQLQGSVDAGQLIVPAGRAIVVVTDEGILP